MWELEFADGAFAGSTGNAGGTAGIVIGAIILLGMIAGAALLISANKKNESPMLAYALPASALGSNVKIVSSIPSNDESKDENTNEKEEE